jgi:hypothetical protein
LSDELDIVGASIEVLVGEVEVIREMLARGRRTTSDPMRVRVSGVVAA